VLTADIPDPTAQNEPTPLRHAGGRARGVLDVLVSLGLIIAVIAAVAGLLAAASYEVTTGTVSFQLRPDWPGGRLIMPLGPAGELSLLTHRMPVDVLLDYRLPEQAGDLLGESAPARPEIEGGVREAFTRFLWSRVPWLALLGAAAGLLVFGRSTWLRAALAAAGGGVLAVGLGAALVFATFATVDRSPPVRYSGLATKVPDMLPLVRALSSGGDQGDRLGRLHGFLSGLEAVATDLTTEPRAADRAAVVRLLLASDIHDNVFGARAAARLAAGGGAPVDAVLFAGDLTDRGTAEEARLFVRVYGERLSPVVMVGGNHENAPAMRVFGDAGFELLSESTTTISGVTILGASDPVAYSPVVPSDVTALGAASERLAAAWTALEPRPQVVLVHDERQAAAVIAAAREEEADLVVAYGNDHVAAVSRDGGVVKVDAGTAGASGYEAIGRAAAAPDEHAAPADDGTSVVGGVPEDPASASPAGGEPPPSARDVYTFQLIDFARDDPRRLLAVTTVSYIPGGRTVVTYLPHQ
jgi:predicted phosphodiesterase